MIRLVTRRRLTAFLAALPTGGASAIGSSVRRTVVTDDTAALQLALSTGSMFNGQGRTYGVSGNLTVGSGFGGLVNVRLKQLQPRGGQRRTLIVQGATRFVIENVAIDRGGDGSEVTDRAQMLNHAGLYLDSCRNFLLSDIAVTGGGIGCGISINNCEDFKATRVQASDIQYRLPRHPDNDAIQGLYFYNSSRFICEHSSARNLGGTDGITHVHDNGRGFAFGGCSNFNIEECEAHYVGQGMDLTGTTGNRFFRLSRNSVNDCATWGIKCANSAQDGLIENSHAARCGIGGFVVSGPTEAMNPRPVRITFKRCTVSNTLDLRPNTTSFGFGVTSVPTIDPTFPRDIHFLDCVAAGRAGFSHMEYGFLNDIAASKTEGHPNSVRNCKAAGYATAPFVGFG
jgi:hypothetical protein